MARILVAYASKKGSTAEIAQAIGKEIRAAGHLVDVTEMKSVSSLESYNAVVIGAPFYMGKIMADMGEVHRQIRNRPYKSTGRCVCRWSGTVGKRSCRPG